MWCTSPTPFLSPSAHHPFIFTDQMQSFSAVTCVLFRCVPVDFFKASCQKTSPLLYLGGFCQRRRAEVPTVTSPCNSGDTTVQMTVWFLDEQPQLCSACWSVHLNSASTHEFDKNHCWAIMNCYLPWHLCLWQHNSLCGFEWITFEAVWQTSSPQGKMICRALNSPTIEAARLPVYCLISSHCCPNSVHLK